MEGLWFEHAMSARELVLTQGAISPRMEAGMCEVKLRVSGMPLVFAEICDRDQLFQLPLDFARAIDAAYVSATKPSRTGEKFMLSCLFRESPGRLYGLRREALDRLAKIPYARLPTILGTERPCLRWLKRPDWKTLPERVAAIELYAVATFSKLFPKVKIPRMARTFNRVPMVLLPSNGTFERFPCWEYKVDAERFAALALPESEWASLFQSSASPAIVALPLQGDVPAKLRIAS